MGNLEQDILRQQPFRSVLEIDTVKSLHGHAAISGESFMVRTKTGKRFKLRYCRRLLDARTIEKNVRKIPHAFPRYYGREGRYLLFDWIEGDQVPKDPSPDLCYKIGKLAGEAHALEDLKKNRHIDDFFYGSVKLIEDILPRSEIRRIKKKYEQIKPRLELDIRLEFHDLHAGNLMMKKGKLFFVDEEGFGHKVKGLGFAKPLMIKKWIRNKKQKEEFWRGYNEHYNNDYFDRDYQDFIAFIQAIRSMANRIKTAKDYSREMKIVEDYIRR